MSVDEIYQAIMALPELERLELIDKVYESMPMPPIGVDLDPNLEAELDRRMSDLEGSIEWSQLRDER